MDERFWINVISGTDASWGGELLRTGLLLAEPIYAFGMGARNLLFDLKVRPAYKVDAPVISVGNITTGGTGKTPVVAWLVNRCVILGQKPGVVSRGYRSLDGQENDEKRLLAQLCPGVPHIQNRDRVAGAREAIAECGCDLIVLDDGLQHRRLYRDFDLVLIDAVNPWGYGHLLPRGLLRESRSALCRAGAILITRSDQVSPDAVNELKREIRSSTLVPILSTSFAPSGLVNSRGESRSIDSLRSARVGAFCGIGNPEGFRRTITSLGIEIGGDAFRAFPDHHHYFSIDIEELASWATTRRFDALLTTRKDLVKLPQTEIGNVPLWGVDIGLRFTDPADDAESLLGSILSSRSKPLAEKQ